MSKLEEIEIAAEQLPLHDFIQFAVWVDQRRKSLASTNDPTSRDLHTTRDHTAFLNSYIPKDEGLYDDAASR